MRSSGASPRAARRERQAGEGVPRGQVLARCDVPLGGRFAHRSARLAQRHIRDEQGHLRDYLASMFIGFS